MNIRIKERLTNINSPELTKEEISELIDGIAEETGIELIYKGTNELSLKFQEEKNEENVLFIESKSYALENEGERCFTFGYDTEPDSDFIEAIGEFLKNIGFKMAI